MIDEEDNFVSRNQFAGDPTLDSVSEGGSSLSSLTGFFSGLANTYSTVKTALDNKSVSPAQVPKQSVGATAVGATAVGGNKVNWVIISLVTLASVVVLILVMRK